MKYVDIRSIEGSRVTAGPVTLTPIIRSVEFVYGGDRGTAVLLWRRPSAVVVSVDGRESRRAIVDVTRCAQVAVVAVAMACVWWTWSRTKDRKE